MHQWLGDYCSGFLYGLLHCSFLVWKKKVVFMQGSLPFKSITLFLMTYRSQSVSLYWIERLSVTLQTATSSASCACSQLCHSDWVLDLIMGDLFFLSLTSSQRKGSWSLTHEGIVPLSFHHPVKLVFVVMRSKFIQRYLWQTQAVTFWSEDCDSHSPLVHNDHVGCSHCSSTSKFRL